MSDLTPDPVARALNLLYNAAIVSPYLREAAETVTAEVERLRARVPNPDDLRLLCDFALGGPHTPWPVVREAQTRVRATLEEA